MFLCEITFTVSRNRFMNPFNRINSRSSDLKISRFGSTKTDDYNVQSSYFKKCQNNKFFISEYETNVYHRNKC